MPEYTDASDVAEALGISRVALIRLCNRHKLPFIVPCRGVAKFTPSQIAAVEAVCSKSSDVAIRASSGSRAPSGQRARRPDDAFANALAATIRTSRPRKPQHSKR